VTEASAHVARFDWSDVAQRTEEVYGALAVRGAKRRPRGPAHVAGVSDA
jgi:hypothetical protein